MAALFALLLCVSLGVNAAQSAQARTMRMQLSMHRQRDMTDVIRAMADIEVNLQKLMIASGAAQSVHLLGETALLAQHVETGLARLPLNAQASSGAMKFAGQMGDYAMTLAAQMSSGAMLTTQDERQIGQMIKACQGLNAHLMDVGGRMYDEAENGKPPSEDDGLRLMEGQEDGDGGIPYPSLIYDGPFSDAQKGDAPVLPGGRVARQQAREAAARYAGVNPENVSDAADSGGQFEAFGFAADTPDGRVSVQVTGQGGHLLWMIPEQAAYETLLTEEVCLNNAGRWLAEMGFGEMQRCFVQIYDGMAVANFAAVEQGVLVYPQQVKVQVSMATGRVVGAECSGYWLNLRARSGMQADITREEAEQMLSSRLHVTDARLAVIPDEGGETLCWEFAGDYAGETYYVYINARTGEAEEILRVAMTQEGETAI